MQKVALDILEYALGVFADIDGESFYNADLVTDLPPPIWYRHVGELIYLDSRHEAHRNMTMSSILQDKARGQGQAVTQRIKEWSNLKLDDRPVKPLLDHAPIAYVVHCWNLLIEQRRENRATLRP